VVDDAIVVIENGQRHIGEWSTPTRTNTSNAMGEVTSAVIATSLVAYRRVYPGILLPRNDGNPLSPVSHRALSARFHALTRRLTWVYTRSRAPTRTRSRRASSPGDGKPRRPGSRSRTTPGLSRTCDRPARRGPHIRGRDPGNSQSGKGGVAYVMKTRAPARPARRLQIEFSRAIQADGRRRRRGDRQRDVGAVLGPRTSRRPVALLGHVPRQWSSPSTC